MKVKVEYEIENCKECPHSVNSAQLHDDPFTSSPSTLSWFCTKSSERFRIIFDADVIDSKCPIKV